jgi:hypothetical protein
MASDYHKALPCKKRLGRGEYFFGLDGLEGEDYIIDT